MKLPGGDQLAGLFRDLLGRKVQVKTATQRLAPEGCHVFTYVGPGGETLVLGLANLACAAYAGAALAMIPKGVAEESIRKKKLDDNLRDNFYEVVNVMSGAINAGKDLAVRLQSLTPASSLTGGEAQKLAAARTRTDFEIDISDYGIGRFSLLVG